MADEVPTLGGAPLEATAPYDDGAANPPAAMGRFEVTGVLGRGGMGVVLAGRDPALDRPVAIKVLRPDLWAGEGREERARFAREGHAMARLNHPNVVTVYEVGEASGQPFLAMELVDGQTLRGWQTATRSWREVLAIYVEAGRGLAAAHRAGLIHRDFKPDNVLLGSDGRPRVSDFGLVSAGGGAVSSSEARGLDISGELTVQGRALGTPAYMAPEQWTGDPVDARSDQFAYCVALWEALCGARPFVGATALELREAVLAGRHRPAPTERRLPRWLVAAVERGLAVAPAARWPSMDALLTRLANPPVRRWPLAAAAVGTLAIGATALVITRGGDDDPCPLPVQRVAAVWGPGGRDALLAKVRAIDPAGAEPRLRAITRRVDPFLVSWARLDVDACRAATAVADTVAAQRRACLDARLAGLTETIAMIASRADGPALDRALPALADVAPVDGCSDAKVIATYTPPASPAARTEAAAIETEARAIELARLSGEMQGLHERGQALLTRARALGHAPATARALMAVARLEADRNDNVGAAALLREQTEVAARAFDDHAAALAWTNLLRMTAFDLGKPQDALGMIPAARAAVLRAGDGPDLRAQLLAMEAEVYVQVDRIPDALTNVDEAVRVLDAAGARDPASPLHDRLGETLSVVGTTRMSAQKYEDAIEAFRGSIRITEESYGQDHPLTAYAYLNMAFAQKMLGRPLDALASTGEAVRIRRARLGPSPGLAWAINAHANALRELQRPREAAPLADEAYAMAVKTMAPDDPTIVSFVLGNAALYEDLGDLDKARALNSEVIAIGARTGAENINVPIAYFNRAELARKAGHCADALDDYAQARDRFTAYRGADDPYNIFALRGLGQCLALLHRPAEAIAPLERAVAMQVPAFAADQHAAARHLLGHALVVTGRDRARGRRELAAAAAEAKAVGPDTEAELAKLLPDD